MILSCRFCSKRFELRDEVLPAEGLRARCPALFFLFYYPMALGITSVFNTIAPILNPALVLKAVARIPKEYAWVVGFFVASGLVEAVLSFVLEAGVPVLGRVVASIGWAYVTFVQMHVLGWTLYQTEDRLNWDIAI